MSTEDQKSEPMMEADREQETTPNDHAGLSMSGHILIRDKETGEELINKRNAIHYGNMANLVANALIMPPALTFISWHLETVLPALIRLVE